MNAVEHNAMEHMDGEPASNPRPGLIAYFAGNPIAANLLMVLILVSGVVAGLRIAVEDYPEFDWRTVLVTVIAPGSSPREVEEDIVRRVEESVIGLEGIREVRSTSAEHLGTISVELTTFANADRVRDDIQQAVDNIANFPPPNAERPEVKLLELNREVITLAVSSDVLDEDALRGVAEEVRSELLQLPSTARVDLHGTRDREISIELSAEALRRHGLSLSQVANTVRRNSVNLTSGELRTESGGVVLHTVAKRARGEDFAGIPVVTRLDGTIVTLGDVATIRDAFVDGGVIARVDGVPAVFVRVGLTEGRSIVAIAEEVRAWLAGYQTPRDAEVRIWNNLAQPHLDRFGSLTRTMVAGVILVFLLLVLVFDLRAAVWIAVGIPLSFVGALVFFEPANLTVNTGTLLALFLMIGLVVDDALVVGESIAAERERGKAPLAAAIDGVRSVVAPITIAAVTTVLAFVPFHFMTAAGGQVVSVFPPVVLFVLAVSLLESVFILPAHLGHAGRWSLWPLTSVQARTSAWLQWLTDRTVGPAVSWAVRHVAATLAAGVAVVVVSLLLLRFDAVRLVLATNPPTDFVQAALHMPVGTPLEKTRAATEQVAAAVDAVNEELPGESVKSVAVLAGQPVNYPVVGPLSTHSHIGGVRVHLNEPPLRRATAREVIRAWRQALGPVPHMERLEFWTDQVRARPNVAYILLHTDETVLQQAAAEMQSFLQGIPGVVEIHDSLAPGKRHLRVELTPAGEAAGLSPRGVAAQLRARFHGVEVQRIQRGREELKVMVRYPPEDRTSLQALADERIRVPVGTEVPLFTVAHLDESREPAVRMRVNGEQAAEVNARADVAVVTASDARAAIERDLVPELLERYPGLRIEPGRGVRDNEDSVRTLTLLLPVVLIAMYVLMAGFLRSYWKPLVAAAGFPLSLAGAVLLHWILGWDFDWMSIFGVIAVCGVAVNDSLVLLDRYNTIRRENEMVPAIAAASAATRHRFRAVFLTSLTTILGLSPLLYERGEDLIFIVPFVVSMVGGLVLTGMFTLFILPALVMVIDGARE
ncbi:MAG: efflux RND transporter permease subunit [Caldilineaceae bacterium SB0665_bin_21]|nr:efflux RND transporter permease subunit [Caldilineaceae bacterium SB0665_bin_21]MYA04740.1 efflux RND transporter permease subunit [Caldilineaceae bacterium SB0664_bin_22]